MDLKEKNVLITGSTRGIGLAIAEAFAKEGANVVLNGRSTVSNEIIQRIESYGVKCGVATGDIAKFEEAGQILADAEAALGNVDILVNNAGITNDKLLIRMSEADFTQCLQVNLVGAFNLTQQVLKKMYKKRQGTIINMSSVVGLTGNVGQANYAASKAGLIGFTKSVAREAAARNITCNAIAPGFIETEMTEALNGKVKEQTLEQIPLKKYGQVEDVANVAVFLAKNPYITGQVINVDGGMVMNG